MVDELPSWAFSDQCPSERRENDERASQRITREYFAIFSSGKYNFLHFVPERDEINSERDETDSIECCGIGPDLRSRVFR